MVDVTESLQRALTGRYRIDRPLGKGGMATVYLARDLKHERDVAIKVLDPELAVTVGAERFLSEIRTTARLQHPHILPLLDSGDAGDGLLYYVMPVVTGESLRARLQREVQIPIDDALRVATQVAEALDYAHRQDVVHRDIKPENILLHDGQALVADFGIALALRAADTESRLTGTGISIGTPHYMSPEQAAGERTQSARTDIYALGAVLHEMLCGEPPFTGPTPQSVIAKTMSQKPTPIRVLRETVPDHVETTILRALQKLPADRFGSAAEFAQALRGNASIATSRRSLASRRWPLAAVALVVLAAIAAWAVSQKSGNATTAATTARVTVPVARGFRLPTASAMYPLNISPDGRTLVYVAERDGVRRLLVRQLAEFRDTELPGTEEATHPAVSGDGRWIAYFARGRLFKVSVAGGEPIPIVEAGGTGGASWFGDSLLFAAGGRLFVVSASGGTATHVGSARTDSAYSRYYNARGARWPQMLPGEKHILLALGDSIAVMNRQTGSLAMLLLGDQPSFLPSGHLVFSAGEGRVRVAPFDLSRFAVTGAPEPVFEAFRGPGSGANYFAVSSSGTLVYVPGGFDRALIIVDRNGRETAVPSPRRGYRFPRISPDGSRAAVTIDPRPSKTWIVDVRTGALAPVSGPGVAADQHQLHPVWSPDGREVAYGRTRGIEVAVVDGTPRVRSAFTDSTSALVPDVWLPSGQLLGHTYGSAGSDIVSFRIGDSTFTRLVATDALETQVAVSPDGRWLAYSSDASGAREVYVRPYRGPGAAVAVTTSGGVEPRWARNGSELYYRRGQDIWAVTVRPGARLSLSEPRRLFGGPYDFQQDDNWDVAPDGSFLMVMADPNAATQFLVVLNWFDELRARFRRGS